MTPQERKLWYLFLQRYPVKVYKQRVIAPYIVDFYCAAAKLVIEIDGTQHYLDPGKAADGLRDRALLDKGLHILRFSNREIDREFQAVCERIHLEIEKRKE